jgi:hypothetical protein
MTKNRYIHKWNSFQILFTKNSSGQWKGQIIWS